LNVPSTSVHMPAGLIRKLDLVAKRRQVSRNRLITEACQSAIGVGRREWPKDFFADDRLAARDRDLLRSTFDNWMTQTIARQSKTRPPF